MKPREETWTYAPGREGGADVTELATCHHYDEDDTGVMIGPRCGRLATHYSCCNSRGRPLNSCAEHKCRCPQAPVAPASVTPRADAQAGAREACSWCGDGRRLPAPPSDW